MGHLIIVHEATGRELSRDEALGMIRPLDAIGATSTSNLAKIIKAWTGGPDVLTHWEQAMTSGPEPVDLSAEPVGLVPRSLGRLFDQPGARGEVWRNITAADWEPQAAELLARWAARFYKGYDLEGAIRAADAADALLGAAPIKSHPFTIWCSQSLFLFCRSLGEAFDLCPGYDPIRDGVDPAEAHAMIKSRGALWGRILRWETR